jgi:hypothetical protein
MPFSRNIKILFWLLSLWNKVKITIIPRLLTRRVTLSTHTKTSTEFSFDHRMYVWFGDSFTRSGNIWQPLSNNIKIRQTLALAYCQVHSSLTIWLSFPMKFVYTIRTILGTCDNSFFFLVKTFCDPLQNQMKLYQGRIQDFLKEGVQG